MSTLQNEAHEPLAETWGQKAMDSQLPVVYLARHGETAWTLAGRHISFAHLSLTLWGECNASGLGEWLVGLAFYRVFTSPLQRARQTCALAGFDALAELDSELVEWNYGGYEGRSTAEIVRERPGWQLFRDGCPDGESPAARAESVLSRLRSVSGDVLLISKNVLTLPTYKFAVEISEEQYACITDSLPRQRGNVSLSNLQLLNAVLYVLEHGCKWRGLPCCAPANPLLRPES